MKLIKYTDACQINDGGRVCAIGFFDGVHIGHRALFDATRERAVALSLPFSVFTFISENESIKKGGRLYNTEEKLSLIEEYGADEVILADFELLRNLSAEEFVFDLLIKKLNTVCAVTGKDFRFGKGAVATASDLERMMKANDRDIVEVADVELFGKKISTTEIKTQLLLGNVRRANEMLGAIYRASGTVEHGNGQGTAFGFPTVNLKSEKDTLLKRGVYRTATMIDGKLFPSVTNVGTCPTLGEREPHTETYIIDFSSDLYGKEVTVFFIDFMREERAFSTKESLTAQVMTDIEKAKKEFSNDGRKLD